MRNSAKPWQIPLILVGIVLTAWLLFLYLPSKLKPNQADILNQQFISIQSTKTLTIPTLQSSEQQSFGLDQLKGHWSILFFGFTSCPHICPTSLALLRDTQQKYQQTLKARIFFISVDPERDTPAKIKHYLAKFSTSILGVTGKDANIKQFASEVQAGYQKNAKQDFDHSTSLFVINPQVQLAGVILRPNQPEQIFQALTELQTANQAHPEAR